MEGCTSIRRFSMSYGDPKGLCRSVYIAPGECGDPQFSCPVCFLYVLCNTHKIESFCCLSSKMSHFAYRMLSFIKDVAFDRWYHQRCCTSVLFLFSLSQPLLDGGPYF